MKEKITKWMVYSAILSLAPILFHVVRLIGRGHEFSLGDVLGNGELLIVSALLSAAAVGEIVASGRNWKLFKLISGGGCLLVLLVASAWFADIALAESTSRQNIATGSIAIYIFAISASLSCVVLSELE